MAARELVNMHPTKHRSHSAQSRGRNSTPWGVAPVETLPDPKEEPSKSENDHTVGAKKRTRSNQERCSTPPRRPSQRIKKKPRKYSFQEEEEDVATEFRGCVVDPKNRGKRSVRPRGNKPACTSWAMSLDGFHNLGTAARKLRSVGSERMKATPADTGSSFHIPKDMAMFEQNSVADGLAEWMEGNGAGANCTDEQTSVPDSTSPETKDRNHGGDNVQAKLKVGNGACANSVVHSVLKESNVADDALAKTDQTNNDHDPLKDRAIGESDSKTISALHLGDRNVNFDLSSAESALASLYGEFGRDMCIEFAVKLLLNETPLPKEAAEIEEFFTQKIHGEKSAKRLRQEEPSNSCSVWGYDVKRPTVITMSSTPTYAKPPWIQKVNSFLFKNSETSPLDGILLDHRPSYIARCDMTSTEVRGDAKRAKSRRHPRRTLGRGEE